MDRVDRWVVRYRAWFRYGYVVVAPLITAVVAGWENWSDQTYYGIGMLSVVGLAAVYFLTDPEFRKGAH